ncbi:MAG TPA: YraN family protein [Ruminococcaceae bacterium]|nr:YraN family protein [Oscillospiraceae bacterium]
MQRHEIGSRGEQEAAKYLKKAGYHILHRNYHTQFGEIDLIVADATFLAFVEVKTRSVRSCSRAFPREAVDFHKRTRIIKTALCYLATHSSELQPRFDIIEIVTETSGNFAHCHIRHLPNAFSADGYQ